MTIGVWLHLIGARGFSYSFPYSIERYLGPDLTVSELLTGVCTIMLTQGTPMLPWSFQLANGQEWQE